VPGMSWAWSGKIASKGWISSQGLFLRQLGDYADLS
jgi:hypothetical protein